jgi:hypothetical protein
MRAVHAIVLVLLACGGDRSSSRPQPTFALGYATFLGGTAVDDCDAVGVERSGAILLGCHSDSPDLPTGESEPYTIKGDLDAFAIKLSADGRRVEYLTQIGGSAWEAVMDVAVNDRGFAYVVGTTYSPDLPSSDEALSKTYGGGEGDAFVARLSPSGGIL